jgi:hypothetical protein
MASLPMSGDGPAEMSAHLADYVISAAIWAPSVHNTQPWWFTADDAEICLYADSSRQLAIADPDRREMMISCGAALFTARLALRSLGYIPATHVLPDATLPLLVARLSWPGQEPRTDYERQLFRQVRTRRTHRGGFAALPVERGLLTALQRGAERDGARFRVITDAGGRAVLAGAVKVAEQTVELDAAYVRELADWVSPPGSGRLDGLPATAYPPRPEHTTPDFPGRDFAHGHRWGADTQGSRTSSWSPGVVCLLTTAGDGPADWVRAGEALQRVLLASAACGVAAALHSQPIELAAQRELIRTRLTDGDYPQLVVRLGTAMQTAVSVRRPVASVLRPPG